jgi:arginyl-tRNA synthetase
LNPESGTLLMKEQIANNLSIAVTRFLDEQKIHLDAVPAVVIDHVKDNRHGDLASNIAMILAKPAGLPPRKIAEGLLALLPEIAAVEKTEIAGPGFINFFLSKTAHLQIVPDILAEGKLYGKSSAGKGQTILLEFVSSNPTGPIHIGHGRGAAYGSVLARLLTEAGYAVTTEYYVNDAGRQMDILATSVWLRLLQIRHRLQFSFPANAYQGKYIEDIASGYMRSNQSVAVPDVTALRNLLDEQIDEDEKIDLIIAFAKTALGHQVYNSLFDYTLDVILGEIREDLAEFGVSFDNWFSERTLIRTGAVDRCISHLKASGDIYEQDGALWFRSTRYGDEKDRVVIRENGQATYFASDIAYHQNKYERGFDEIIDIWGADHHGYIPRVKGAITAMGLDPARLTVLLVQFATLYRDGQKLQMSTRSGEFVTLKQLRLDVGNDATRFFYVTRKSEQHLDFDLDLAKSRSNENPVYYIQYAHARIASVFKQMQERGLKFEPVVTASQLSVLTEPQELELIKTLSRYREIIVTYAGVLSA